MYSPGNSQTAAEILDRHGLTYKAKVDGEMTWHRLEECPVCKKENAKWECALGEKMGDKGQPVLYPMCQHVKGVMYSDFMESLGETIGEKKGSKKTYQRKPRAAKVVQMEDLKPLNRENSALLRSTLKKKPEAMEYLRNRGLEQSTLDHFLIALKKLSPSKDPTSGNSIIYPMFSRDFEPLSRYGNYNVPGLTLNPANKNGWQAGGVMTYFSDVVSSRTKLFVCEGPKDVWRLWQAIQGTELAETMLLITSTHGDNIPDEWREESFWSGWEEVYFGHDNDGAGEKIVTDLAGIIGRDAYRVRVPEESGKDWTDFFQAGETVDTFMSLIEDAPVASQEIETEDMDATGLLAFRPIDINGAYHNGHLYYPVRALQREKVPVEDDKGNFIQYDVLESLKTVVVRSDGAVLTISTSKPIPGARKDQWVLRLSDNTLIESEPEPSRHSSWLWDSISKFKDARRRGEKATVRPMSAMYDDIMDYLRNQIWLPYQDDYTLLALTTILTYVQSVFDAIPLFLANGPRGSGKTELGLAMVNLCANGALVGQGSAATIARMIDSTRGFVVIDDLESAGSKKDGDQFSELVQALKLSYKKETATKQWTDVKNMKVETLNFYGVKMINNTSGVDSILGSRMFTIQTRRMLPEESKKWSNERRFISEKPTALRNELHTWAFQEVEQVEETYRRMFPQSVDRDDEIAAPLRVIAEILGDAQVKQSLEAALLHQVNGTKDLDDPIELLDEALQNVVLKGYLNFSVQHIILEIRKMLPENYGIERTNDIPEVLKPEWVGKNLNGQGWVEKVGKTPKRVRLFDMNLRTYTVADSYMALIRERLKQDGAEDISPWESITPQDVRSFCRECDGCPYKASGCNIMERRLAVEAERAAKEKRAMH